MTTLRRPPYGAVVVRTTVVAPAVRPPLLSTESFLHEAEQIPASSLDQHGVPVARFDRVVCGEYYGTRRRCRHCRGKQGQGQHALQQEPSTPSTKAPHDRFTRNKQQTPTLIRTSWNMALSSTDSPLGVVRAFCVLLTATTGSSSTSIHCDAISGPSADGINLAVPQYVLRRSDVVACDFLALALQGEPDSWYDMKHGSGSASSCYHYLGTKSTASATGKTCRYHEGRISRSVAFKCGSLYQSGEFELRAYIGSWKTPAFKAAVHVCLATTRPATTVITSATSTTSTTDITFTTDNYSAFSPTMAHTSSSTTSTADTALTSFSRTENFASSSTVADISSSTATAITFSVASHLDANNVTNIGEGTRGSGLDVAAVGGAFGGIAAAAVIMLLIRRHHMQKSRAARSVLAAEIDSGDRDKANQAGNEGTEMLMSLRKLSVQDDGDHIPAIKVTAFDTTTMPEDYLDVTGNDAPTEPELQHEPGYYTMLKQQTLEATRANADGADGEILPRQLKESRPQADRFFNMQQPYCIDFDAVAAVVGEGLSKVLPDDDVPLPCPPQANAVCNGPTAKYLNSGGSNAASVMNHVPMAGMSTPSDHSHYDVLKISHNGDGWQSESHVVLDTPVDDSWLGEQRDGGEQAYDLVDDTPPEGYYVLEQSSESVHTYSLPHSDASAAKYMVGAREGINQTNSTRFREPSYASPSQVPHGSSA